SSYAACSEPYGRMSVDDRGPVGDHGRTRRLAREVLQVVALDPSARRQYDELASGAVLEADFGEEVAGRGAVGTERRQHLDAECPARQMEAWGTVDVEAPSELLATGDREPGAPGRVEHRPEIPIRRVVKERARRVQLDDGFVVGVRGRGVDEAGKILRRQHEALKQVHGAEP